DNRLEYTSNTPSTEWTSDSKCGTSPSDEWTTYSSTGASPSIDSTNDLPIDTALSTESRDDSFSSTTESANQSTGLPLWAIIVIISFIVLLLLGCCVGVIIIIRRHLLSLKAQVVEERIKNHKTGMLATTELPQQPHSRYFDLPGKNDEWEIDRSFVSIKYSKKLG
ncbi:hypothetical protein PENTCL1PPCAC_20495, partial [Pristionchus entomophagus]